MATASDSHAIQKGHLRLPPWVLTFLGLVRAFFVVGCFSKSSAVSGGLSGAGLTR